MSSTVLPTLKLYWQTPLRDVLRLQLTGRLDWRSRLAESGLPADVCATLFNVVQKTRLYRLEKAQVCDELIAHFQDGFRSGRSYQNILDEFGDINDTATLISRSKKRNRSMFQKIGRIAGYLSLGVLASYVAVAIYFFLGQPNPSVDFMQDLNVVATSQKEQDKAWPIYRAAWIKYDFCERHFPELYYEDDENAQRNGQLLNASDERWPEAVAFLRSHTDLLSAFRAAAQKPALGLELKSDMGEYAPEDAKALFPHRFEENGQFDQRTLDAPDPGSYDDHMSNSLIHVLLPHVQSFRSIARMFKIDTRLAIEENDSDRAVENILSTFGVAGHAAESPILVCGLVAFAVTDLGFDQIEEVIEAPGFLSPDQIETIQKTVAEIPIRGYINLAGERAMMYDILQRVYTDDGNGDGRMTSQGIEIMQTMHTAWGSGAGTDRDPFVNVLEKVVGPVSLFAVAGRKEMKQRYDQLMDEVELAFDQPIATYQLDWEHLIRGESKTERLKYQLLDLLFPAIDAVRNGMEIRMARRDAVELVLAAERFKRKNRDWPSSADQLTPVFVDSLPTDPLTGGPLKLVAKDDGGLTVYSVGNNENDDNGQPLTEKKTGDPVTHYRFQRFEDEPHDGDWILWPNQDR